MKTTMMVVAAMALATTVSAQVVNHELQARAEKEHQLQVLTEKVSAGGLHVSFESRPVTGAPYSAEAITETVQSLADGNRIVRRTTVRIYRDGKGRTRRETLGPDGEVRLITISDPATGHSYTIDAGTNTVHSSGVATYVTLGDGPGGVAGGGGSVSYYVTTDASQHTELKATESKQQAELKSRQRAELEVKARQEAELQAKVVAGQPVTVTSAGAVSRVAEHKSVFDAAPTKEDLGQQVIEGVVATGTRTTSVIAAGTIGNELPITVTSEEWTSVDLKVLVMTRHADPRSGETTYRLTGITRGEPNPSLFDTPAGVTVK